MTPNGLQNLINEVMLAPANSLQFDEYQIMKGLLATTGTKEVVCKGYHFIRK